MVSGFYGSIAYSEPIQLDFKYSEPGGSAGDYDWDFVGDYFDVVEDYTWD